MARPANGRIDLIPGAGHGSGYGNASEHATQHATVRQRPGSSLTGDGSGRDGNVVADLIASRRGMAPATYGDVSGGIRPTPCSSRRTTATNRLRVYRLALSEPY